MKITVSKSVNQDIEVPIYFEQNGRFCKIINDIFFISVNNQELDTKNRLAPSITVNQNEFYFKNNDFSPISKAEFDLKYLETEIILNKLKNI